MILYDKRQEQEHVQSLRQEEVSRKDRGTPTAALLVQTGERCFCGGSCSLVMVACLDCQHRGHVEPNGVQHFNTQHAGHAVIVAHTAPRTIAG